MLIVKKGTVLVFLLLSVVDISVKAKKGQSVQIDEVNKIWIFDNLLQHDELRALFEYIGFISKAQFMHQNIETAVTRGITPFYAMINMTEVKNIRLFSTVKTLVERAVGKETSLIDIHGEFLHSLDPKPPVKDDCDEDTYHASIFLNELWMLNNYGQLSFYSDGDDGRRLEIVYTVHPKPARMVVWPSCVTYVAHPPAVNYFVNLRMLKMTFAANKNGKSEDFQSETDAEDSSKISFGDFRFTNKNADRSIDYAKHLRRSFFDSQQRGVYVFDDLFTLEELRQFRQHLLNFASPHVSQYDGGPLEDHDNVQWISGYSTSEFVKTPVWQRVKELVRFVTKEDQWYPYDVALNYIRPADHTRIHPDAEPHQVEYTYLLYMTENTTQSDFGETMFFEREMRKSDGIHEFTFPGGEEFEPIGAVWPKFGRVAIFRNIIQHSARPLSSAHLDCRFTFATKVARSQRLAYIKKLYESMEAVGELDQKQQKLNRQLNSGQHDDPKRSHLSLESLENKLEETRQGKKKFVDLQRTMLMQMMK